MLTALVCGIIVSVLIFLAKGEVAGTGFEPTTALIGDWAGSMVCKERLYHALARDFLPQKPAAASAQ